MKTIVLIGALDTKGPEFAFVKSEIERRGHRALVINTVNRFSRPMWTRFKLRMPAANHWMHCAHKRTAGTRWM